MNRWLGEDGLEAAILQCFAARAFSAMTAKLTVQLFPWTLMDSRTRVTMAISHREADRIPTGEITVSDRVIEAGLGRSPAGFEERAEFVDRLGIDAICVSPVWPVGTRGLPDPADAIWEALEKWTTRTDRFVFAMLDGVFGWGPRLMGFERFLTASFKKSRDLSDLINRVEALNSLLAHAAVDAGANGILLADDIAYQHGTVVNPLVLRNLLFPSLARLVNKTSPLGVPVFFHSDGNLGTVIEDLVDVGFHGIQCLEAAAGMDLTRLKAAYGERICLWGNLDPRFLFLPQNPEQLKRIIDETLDSAAPGGGYIFGTSSGLVDGMKLENIEVVYREVHRRRYSAVSPKSTIKFHKELK